MKLIINIIKETKGWAGHKSLTKPYLKNTLLETTKEIAKFELTKSLEITLLLTNDDKITKLNSEFLGKNKPTNVLSFPDRDLSWKDLSRDTFKGDILLGDIAFSYQTIKKESESYNISFENHFTHLLVHAILHLCGYDHEDDELCAIIMQELEIKILKKLDIKEPVIYAKET